MTDTRWGRGWLYPLCYNYGPVPSSTSLSRGKAKRYRVCCLIIPACIHCPSSMHHCSVKCRINFIASREMDSSSWCSVRPRGRLCYDTWIASPGTLIVEVSRFLVVGGGFFLRSFRPLSLLLEPKTPTIFRKSRFPSTWRLTVMTRAHVSAAVLNWALMGLWARLIWIRNLRPNVCQIYQILYIR